MEQINKLQEIKKFYNKYFDLPEAYNRAPKTYKQFLKYLQIKKGSKLLDVSCGRGNLLNCAGNDLFTFGIDLSEKAIRLAKRNSPNSLLLVGNAEELPFQRSRFDYLTNIGSLEHLINPEEGLREMVRVAKNNARFCIVLPNSDFFYYKLLGKKGTEQAEIQEKLASLNEWKIILQKGGLKILSVKRERGPNILTDRSFSGLIWGVIRKLSIISTFLLPLKYTYVFVFLCKKVEKDLDKQ